MKKRLFRILAIILVLLLALFFVIQILPGFIDTVEAKKEKGSNNWMSQLSDDLPLNEISIPGAHDYGSRNVQLALFSKCQDRTAAELLTDGFRYLDIRLGVETVDKKQVLGLYHGFTHCLTGNSAFSNHLLLDELLLDCKNFLAENPSETILFVVKQEHGDESVADFEKLLNSYTDDSFLLTDTIPTLGEARGKIVLFRRYKDEAGLGKDSGIYLDWEKQKANDDVTLTYGTYEENGFKAYVQDRYKYSVEDKWNAFLETVKDSDSLLEGGVVINFLSTNGTPSYGHPYKYAKDLNSLFLEKDFGTGRLGWVVVDFGNAEIAKKIYSQN